MIVAPPASDWLVDYTPFRSLPLDQEALRIYEHAYVIGLTTEIPEAPKISFSTLLIALLRGEDETSRWFAEQAPDFGPRPDLVYAGKGQNATTVAEFKRPASGKPDDIKLSTDDRQLLTDDNSREALEPRRMPAQRRIAGAVVHAAKVRALAPQRADAFAQVGVGVDGARRFDAFHVNSTRCTLSWRSGEE